MDPWVALAEVVGPVLVTLILAGVGVVIPLGLRHFRLREKELDLAAEAHRLASSDKVRSLEARVQSLEQTVGVLAQLAGRGAAPATALPAPLEAARDQLAGPPDAEQYGASPVGPLRTR